MMAQIGGLRSAQQVLTVMHSGTITAKGWIYVDRIEFQERIFAPRETALDFDTEPSIDCRRRQAESSLDWRTVLWVVEVKNQTRKGGKTCQIRMKRFSPMT